MELVVLREAVFSLVRHREARVEGRRTLRDEGHMSSQEGSQTPSGDKTRESTWRRKSVTGPGGCRRRGWKQPPASEASGRGNGETGGLTISISAPCANGCAQYFAEKKIESKRLGCRAANLALRLLEHSVSLARALCAATLCLACGETERPYHRQATDGPG